MRSSFAVFLAAVLSSPAALRAMQTPAAALPAAAQSQPAAPAPPTASTLLKPALDTVQQTVSGLKLDKWKRGTVRDEAGDNIHTVLRDFDETLPSLLRDADASPASIGKTLPVSRNVDALYDVVLRVVEAARVSAPADQVTALQQALIGLSKARGALDDRMQESAAAQDKQIKDLRSSLQAQSAVKCPVAPPPPACPAPAPAKRTRKPAAKPAAKPPAATPATTPQAATPAPPKQ